MRVLLGVLAALAKQLQRVWGASVQAEPESEQWSSHRPDLTLQRLGLIAGRATPCVTDA